MLTSWRTTLGGILLGIGVPLAATGTGIYKTIGVVLSSLGAIIMGISGRDNVVSSEQAGASTLATKP